jgi:SGNH domain (fused to AT3 domains)
VTLNDRFQRIAAASVDFGSLPRSCWSEGRSFEVKVCEFGAADAAHTVVLFGDSHAMQWFNPMQTATQEEGWRLVTILRPGCAASDINPHLLSAAADHCRQWRAEAIGKIIAFRPAAVVMASYNGATLRGDSITATLMPAEEIHRGTRRTLEALSSAGLLTVVLRDTPLPPFNIPACLARRESNISRGESCDFRGAVALNTAAHSAELAAAEGLPEVYFLDMNDLFCPGTMCHAIVRDLLVYRDEDHITGTFAESLAPSLRMRLFPIVSSTHPAEHQGVPSLVPGGAGGAARFD